MALVSPQMIRHHAAYSLRLYSRRELGIKRKRSDRDGLAECCFGGFAQFKEASARIRNSTRHGHRICKIQISYQF